MPPGSRPQATNVIHILSGPNVPGADLYRNNRSICLVFILVVLRQKRLERPSRAMILGDERSPLRCTRIREGRCEEPPARWPRGWASNIIPADISSSENSRAPPSTLHPRALPIVDAVRNTRDAVKSNQIGETPLIRFDARTVRDGHQSAVDRRQDSKRSGGSIGKDFREASLRVGGGEMRGESNERSGTSSTRLVIIRPPPPISPYPPPYEETQQVATHDIGLF